MDNTLIPRDVLLYLATFLDPYTGNSLRLTCKFLHVILTNMYEKPWEVLISYDALKLCVTSSFCVKLIKYDDNSNKEIASRAYFREDQNYRYYIFIYTTDYSMIRQGLADKFATLIIKEESKSELSNKEYLITLSGVDLIIRAAKETMKGYLFNDSYKTEAVTKEFNGHKYCKLFLDIA